MNKHTKDDLDRFVERGIPTGGFLKAVLTNDLFDAVRRADLENRSCLCEIVEYIHSHTPKKCYGSEGSYWSWTEGGGLGMPFHGSHTESQQKE